MGIPCGSNPGRPVILAIVIVDGDSYEGAFHLRKPFTNEPNFGVASINYDLADLLSKASIPETSQ